MKTLKYWYKVTIFSCPVCGSERRFRERHALPKAGNPYEWFDYYDYCND